MDAFKYAAGIVVAALALIIAFAVTIWGYLKYCAKHPSKKLRAEISVVISAVCVSLIIRLAIGYAALPNKDMTVGAESLFQGIMSAVAGLLLDAPDDISTFGFTNGLSACFYYGLIAYVGFVFLAVITVGISYDFYSKVQTAFMRLRKDRTYYVFTSVTKDSLVLAEDIKAHESRITGRHFIIIFLEGGESSFSRKNPLHRKIMENGFYYFSDPRSDDKGRTVSIFAKFKFKAGHFKNTNDENRNKLFHVFALDDGDDYESNNADIIFDDITATLDKYVYRKKGLIVNDIPTVINYHILAGGEINYESYDRRTDDVFLKRLSDLRTDNASAISFETKDVDFIKEINGKIQINVVNEATLSSYELVSARNMYLDRMDGNAFERDSMPDGCGAYRIAVIGFGKTGQYAMEELYTHTAHLIKDNNDYVPTQFIADIYDAHIDDKSGIFAYNHPLFRCMQSDKSSPQETKEVVAAANAISGKAIDVLYSECAEKTGREIKKAKKFIDEKMAFPIVVMHKENCFKYPFMDDEGTEIALKAVCDNNIRDFVVALGNDERNIAMANMLIGSFNRVFLELQQSGKKSILPKIKIYVNLIESRNLSLLDWRTDSNRPTGDIAQECIAVPDLSVIPFGLREKMYSYDSFVDDYKERLYNFGYSILSEIIDEKNQTEINSNRNRYDDFKIKLASNYNCYRKDENVSDKWMKLNWFLRISNKSALAFAINYYKYKNEKKEYLQDEDWDYLMRLEHERWSRFFISHGWMYATYNKSGILSKESKEIEKTYRRSLRQHNCLCPFDEMLDDSTKAYDRGNVELGFVEGIANPQTTA